MPNSRQTVHAYPVSSNLSLRGAKRRGNPVGVAAILAPTGLPRCARNDKAGMSVKQSLQPRTRYGSGSLVACCALSRQRERPTGALFEIPKWVRVSGCPVCTPTGRRPYNVYPALGGMAEWTIATVLKTVNPHGFVGSNPTPSANRPTARSPLQPGLPFLQQFSEQGQDLVDAQHHDGAHAALQVAFVHQP